MCVNQFARAVAYCLFFALAGCAARAFGASEGIICEACVKVATGKVVGLPYRGRVAIRAFETAQDGAALLAVSTSTEAPLSRVDNNLCRIVIPQSDPISGRPALGVYTGMIGDPATVLASLSEKDITGLQVNLSRFARSKNIECQSEPLPFQVISAHNRAFGPDGSITFEVILWQRKYD